MEAVSFCRPPIYATIHRMNPRTRSSTAIVASALSIALCFGERSVPSACADSGPTFYVSPQGSDQAAGTIDRPFATLAHARNAVRKLQGRGGLNAPVTVYLRGGTYAIREPLVFSPEDSGTSASPITYAAYQDEKPVLSGGRLITGWTKGSSGLWTAQLPDVQQGRWYFRELFVNGERRTRARTPNAGSYFHVDGQIPKQGPASFRIRSGDIRSAWAGPGDVEVVVLDGWQEFRLFLREVDESASVVKLSAHFNKYVQEHNARFWIENTLDALDDPGEWYLDRRSGTLYYKPMAGEDPSQAQVIAPALQQLIFLKGESGRPIHDIVLRGLTLSHTDWSIPAEGYVGFQGDTDVAGSLVGRTARDVRIEHCVFAHLGGYAVEFGRGSKGVRLTANEMSDLGAGGVKIGDPDSVVASAGPPLGPNGEFPTGYPRTDADASSGNMITDDRIHDLDLVFPGAVAIWIGQSPGNTLAHNEIYNTPYSGISVGWTWGSGASAAHDNVIEFNHVHDIGRGGISDLGAIYVLGFEPGTVVRNNLIHDIARYEQGYGAGGVYLDANCSGVTVENNLVYRTQDAGLHLAAGQDNIVRNNIFANGYNPMGQVWRASPPHGTAVTFEHNIVIWKKGAFLFGRDLDKARQVFDHNLYFRREGSSIYNDWAADMVTRKLYSLAVWKQQGLDTHSVFADPLFADPEHGDFSLPANSPAFQIGFQPFDLRTAGPRSQ